MTASMSKKPRDVAPSVTNRKARFNYEITETIEAGIVLVGAEVKSIRAGKATLQDAWARIDNGEAWLHGCHITPYMEASRYNQPADRPRKLLLHKKEIEKLSAKINEKGMTLVGMEMYFKDNNVKVKLGLGRSKKMHDKRDSIKEKSVKREIDRGLKSYR